MYLTNKMTIYNLEPVYQILCFEVLVSTVWVQDSVFWILRFINGSSANVSYCDI